MSQKTFVLVVVSVLITALITTALNGEPQVQSGEPQAKSGGAQVTPAADSSCEPISYNRRIDRIGFVPSSTGATDIVVDYGLLVGDRMGALQDLSANVLVEIIVGGAVISQTTFAAQFDFLANDAVLCATSWASRCGSIFGDGVCADCDCDYSRSATLPGTTLTAGDMVRATLLPAAGAAPEIRVEDDVLEVTFGARRPCCPSDINGDDLVNVLDLLELLAAWGPCPQGETAGP